MINVSASIEWNRQDATFTDNRYSRAHKWRFDGGAEVPASSSPHVVPLPMSDATAVDPEEAFVAALSSCHMLWFLSIAAKDGFVVDHDVDHAEGQMQRNGQGQLVISVVTLRPNITWAGACRPSDDQVAAMHEQAHKQCFLANSVKSTVRIQPDAHRAV